jgi:hypothetical protein
MLFTLQPVYRELLTMISTSMYVFSPDGQAIIQKEYITVKPD